ncbi:MAG TPA: protein translocase subunit SecD [Planctomycetaceae bacterium]|nr:protein translocase subunit SecD [Planctomycetaceae bacterium]
MASSNSRGTSAMRSLAVLLLPVMAIAAAGCGASDPVVELRELGARVHLDKQGRVTSVAFPPDASDNDLTHLRDLAEVTDLDLSGTNVEGPGLANLQGMKRLERLDLRNTPLGDKGLEELADLSDELLNLRIVYLADTNVTDDGLAELASLKNLKQLFLNRPERPKQPPPRTWKNAINLGIDLAGGTNLVFQVVEGPGKPITNDVMDQMVAAVSRRINPSGTEEVTVRQVGGDRIEVIIPGRDLEMVESVKRRITRLGSLEFAILAARQFAEHRPIIAAAERSEARDVRVDGELRGTWRPIGIDPATGVPKDTPAEVTLDSGITLQAVTRVARDRSRQPLLAPNGAEIQEFLLVIDPDPDRRVTGEYLSSVSREIDQRTGGPAVGFAFNTAGAFLFQQLTSTNSNLPGGIDNRLAILLDDQIHSAPTIQTTISDRGQITGNFTRDEVTDLINVLNAGALQREIVKEPVSEFSISPTLGEDVQNKGRWAIIISGLAVVVFMLLYYRFAGIVADLCLLLNLVLIMGAMALIDATFTLPGLAGIVLTIGMAVDANVLIFERMREERSRGSSLRMAIQNGFGKALSAIIDSNLTTLIAAVVLYVIGTDQVRGFAVTLFIGIVASMFTALYFGRLVFDIAERKRWITDLKMFSVVGRTNLNFLSKTKFCFAGSVLLIGLGIGTFAVRGEDNLDIDFSGGTMVTFEFVEPQQTAEVRRELAQAFGQSITLEKLTIPGHETESSQVGQRFRLRTKSKLPDGTQIDTPDVRHMVAETFKEAGRDLKYVTLESYDRVAGGTTAAAGAAAAGAGQDGVTYLLSFSDSLKEATVSSYLASELEKITAAGEGEGQTEPKYLKPESLLTVVGVRSTYVPAEDGFTQVRVVAAPELADEDLRAAIAGVQETLANEPKFEGVASFASAVATEMQQTAILAILVSMAAIVVYLWFRFQRVMFGLAAMAAVVHDVLFVLGAVALASFVSTQFNTNFLGIEDFRINLPMVAAFLTLVGYSLNDTIVVFDRVREVRGKNPALTADMVNLSLNQTLARTILTSLTTFFVVAILYAVGGEGIHGFAFCLVVGILVGTYSTIWIAAPVLVWLMNRPGSQPLRAGGSKPAARAVEQVS